MIKKNRLCSQETIVVSRCFVHISNDMAAMELAHFAKNISFWSVSRSSVDVSEVRGDVIEVSVFCTFSNSLSSE